MLIQQLIVGAVLAAAIAYVAVKAHSLSRQGAYGAVLLGAAVFGLGGWQWAILLVTFFVCSSALTRAFGSLKEGLSEKYAKGGERDAAQVFSNGGIAGLFVLLHLVQPAAAWPWFGFAGALAAVNADTWATELGVLDLHEPRLITSLGKRVEKGTSGGVSAVGTVASLLAAALIGALAALPFTQHSWAILIAIMLAGFSGSLVDSVLGATVQAMYYCPRDHKETEKHPRHSCGEATVHIRGWRWLNNDLVNVLCSGTGALAAILLSILVQAR